MSGCGPGRGAGVGLVGVMAEARFHTPRSDRESYASEVAAVADRLGLPLMKWQFDAAEVLLEHDENGWRTPSAAVGVPRQSGKSVLMLMLIAWWCMKWENQTVVLVAPDRAGAARRLETLGGWLKRSGEDVSYFRAIGQERLEFHGTGSRAFIVSASRAGGHGESIDLALVDEAWSIPEHTLQALVPAQVARPNWFRLMISTAGDEDSTVWNAQTERGREAVADPESRFGYVEYSAAPGVDVLDDSTWATWMPALGETITVQDVWDASGELQGVGSGEWLRAFANIATRSDSSLFSVAMIDGALGVVPSAPEGPVIGVDVSTGPTAATVVAAWLEDGEARGTVIERRIGKHPGWVVKAVEAAVESHPGASIALSSGPAIMVKDELEQLGRDLAVEVHDLNLTDTAGAAMRLFEHLRDGTITVADLDDVLRDALLAARPKAVGDRWRFDRSVLVDQSPLVALAAAVDVAWVDSLQPTGFLY